MSKKESTEKEMKLLPERETKEEIKSSSLEFGAVLSVVASTFGAGSLTLPYAISKVGIIPGVVLNVITSYAMFYMLKLLVIISSKTKIYSYNKLAEKSISSFLLTLYDVCCITLISGCIMSHLITSYQMVKEILITVFGFDITNYMPYVYLFGYLFLQVPLCLLKNTSKLQIMGVIGSFMIMSVFLIIVAQTPFYLKENMARGLTIKWYSKIDFSYLEVVAIFMFSYSNHNAVLPILNGVKNPCFETSLGIANLSAFIETISYLLVSVGGYLSTLEETPDIFISRKDLKTFSPDYLIVVAKLALSFCLFAVTPLRWSILVNSVKSMAKVDSIPFKYDLLLTVVGLGLINIIVYHVNIITVIGFIGGVCIFMISFYIPLKDYLALSKPINKSTKLIALGITLCYAIVGFSSSITSVINFIKAKK